MPGVSADKKPIHYNKAYHYYRGIRYRINTCSGLPNKTETNGQSIEFTKIQLLRLQNRVRNFHQQCHRYSMGGVSCLKIELLMFESATDCKKTCQKLQSYFAKNELGYGETRDITNSFQISSVTSTTFYMTRYNKIPGVANLESFYQRCSTKILPYLHLPQLLYKHCDWSLVRLHLLDVGLERGTVTI